MEIRQYQTNDFKQVWQMHNSVLNVIEAHAGPGPWDDDLKDIIRNYIQNNGEFLVIEKDHKIIGMGGLLKIDSETCEIKRMRVHPDYQRRGLGRNLLIDLEKIAVSKGYNRLILETSSKQYAAQELYKSCGYKKFKSEKLGKFTLIYFEKLI